MRTQSRQTEWRTAVSSPQKDSTLALRTLQVHPGLRGRGHVRIPGPALSGRGPRSGKGLPGPPLHLRGLWLGGRQQRPVDSAKPPPASRSSSPFMASRRPRQGGSCCDSNTDPDTHPAEIVAPLSPSPSPSPGTLGFCGKGGARVLGSPSKPSTVRPSGLLWMPNSRYCPSKVL